MRERSGFISSGSAKGGKHPIGTIGRIRQKDLPRGAWVRRSRGDRRAFGARLKNQAVVMRWSFTLGAAALALILSIFVVWAYRHSQIRGDEGYVATFTPGDNTTVAALPADEVKEFIRAALTVKTSAQLAEYFELGNSSPQEALAFLGKHVTTAKEQLKPHWLGMHSSANLAMDIGIISLDSEGKPDARLLILTLDEQQRWKLDYTAFARVTTPSWEEILEKPQQGGIVRIMLKRDNYYNGPFSENDWLCFRLTSHDIESSLFGYCKRGSARAMALHSLMQQESLQANGYKMAGDIRATIEIRQPEGALNKQFEIVRVIGQDWVHEDEIFEDTFRGLTPEHQADR